MNVVLYSHGFLPSLGGRQVAIHHLAVALSALGHTVRVVGPAGFFKHRKLHFPYPVHRWPGLRGLFKENVRTTQLAMDTAIWGCDVIHAHQTYPSGYLAVRSKKRRRWPVVITPHGGDIQSIPELGHGRRLDPVMNRKIEYAVQGADLVTAISDNVVEELVGAGAERDRIVVVRNGVDLERFALPRSRCVREWLGVESDARLLATVSNYRPLKGQEFMVRAMPTILAAEPSARLVIIGKGTEALDPLISELGLEGKVVLTGQIRPTLAILRSNAPESERYNEPDHLAEVLGNSELYFSAGIQKNAEGLSLALLEGMASGLPIVATRISGNTDVVRDMENGLLVEPANEEALANAALQILQDGEARLRMSEAARKTAAQYSWLTVARRYVSVYERAIAAASHRSG